MPSNHIYKLLPRKQGSFPSGTYHSEDRLIQALREFNRKRTLPQKAAVHVYETDATPLGIGRKYLGSIGAGSVLMAGEVPVEHVEG